MKKLICLLMTLLCALGLASCTGESIALPKITDLFTLRSRPLAPLSAEESGRMQAHMSANRAFAAENALYTMELDEDQMPVLASYRLEEGRLSRYRRLAEDCLPLWLTEHQGGLYYVNDMNGRRIERLDTDSGERTVLTEGACSCLQIREGRLWFCDETGRFCSCETDGSGREIIIDKSCCYAYVLDGAVIFQSDSEGEILKLFFPEDGKEIALTEAAAYSPVIIGERLYYSMAGQIHSMGIDGMGPEILDSPPLSGAAEFVREDGAWYARGITEDYAVEQWYCPLEGGETEYLGYMGYLWCDYADGTLRVDADYFSDGRLRSFVLSLADGGRCEYLYGKAVNIG